MVLTGSRNCALRILARMLIPKLRLRSPACQIDSSLPHPQQQSLSSRPHTSAASAPACRRPQSTHVCRSTPSQPTDYSVLSYSSAQLYSPQQLAELRGDARDTIVALSSGSGRAGVALIRISGPRADDVLQKVLKPGRALPQPRIAAFTSINSPETGETLDRGIALRFPGPASFTGEDVVELHTHGGPAVVRAVLEALQSQPGVRLAEPGEFTQRAFQAGKLDLTEVEGLADLLAAETEAQRIQALQQSTGAMRKAMATWRSTLLRCLASSEAIIDFGEDEEISADVSLDVLKMAQQLRQHLQQHVTSSRRGELIRAGVKVAIVGRPNAGKSSLLNALAARDAAIVSSTPGTTRDTVEVAVDLAGQKVTLVDTAGLRESTDDIERMGMERARSAMTSADIIAVVLDLQSEPELAAALQQQQQQRDSAGAHEQGMGSPDTLLAVGKSLIEEVVGPLGVGPISTEAAGKQHKEPEPSGGRVALEEHDSDSAVSRPQHQKMLLVLNKSDLSPLSQQVQALSAPVDSGAAPDSSPMSNGAFPAKASTESSLHSSEAAAIAAGSSQPDRQGAADADAARHEQRKGTSHETLGDMAGAVAISCRTGDGLDRLLAKLSQVVADITQSGDADGAIITRLRHRQLIEECVEALLRFEAIWEQPELAAEELRAAAHALGKVTGAIDTEDILDALFGEFCIGK